MRLSSDVIISVTGVLPSTAVFRNARGMTAACDARNAITDERSQDQLRERPGGKYIRLAGCFSLARHPLGFSGWLNAPWSPVLQRLPWMTSISFAHAMMKPGARVTGNPHDWVQPLRLYPGIGILCVMRLSIR